MDFCYASTSANQKFYQSYTNTPIMKKLKHFLPLIALSLPLALMAQNKAESGIDDIYQQLRMEQGVKADSVKYTGDDFDKAGGGFFFQRDTGDGWTRGVRLQAKVAPREFGSIEGKFKKLMDNMYVVFEEGQLAFTVFDNTNTVYGYEYRAADSTLYFLKATAENEMCVPAAWKDKNVVDATKDFGKSKYWRSVPESRLRQLGLARLWAEAKRNFVFMDRVKVDWDSLYVANMPLVEKAKGWDEYTEILQRMAAQLHDGHTAVYASKMNKEATPLRTKLIGGHVYVDAVESSFFKKAGVKRGMELISVNGQPVIAYGSEHVSPTISSSTPQWTDKMTYESYNLLAVPYPDSLRLVFADGKRKLPVSYAVGTLDFDLEQRTPTMSFKLLKKNVGYLRITNFWKNDFRTSFDSILTSILKTEALVIDIRNNGGGNSGNGDYVLRKLATAPFKSDSWSTRQYMPAFISWGQKESVYKSEGNTLQPDTTAGAYNKPIVLLVDNGTFSAAEDFAAAFKSMKRGKMVGTPTGGSTGNPLQVELVPGRVYARICTKHDVAADGTEFVGIGLQPDVVVKETYKSWFRDKQDAVLTKALQLLKE